MEDVHNTSSAASNTTPYTTSAPVPILPCLPAIDLSVAVDSTWLETVVFASFRVWHVLFSGIAALTVLAVVLCCLFRCRIPRTKQEIEADYIRRKITKSFRKHLDKIKLEELEFDPANLLPVYKKVEVLEESRLHSSYIEKKLTWLQKITKFITGKEPSLSEEELAQALGEDGKADGGTPGIEMTPEEMNKVEAIVEAEKTDKSAFNVITDQIAILSLFEDKKERRKREKAERKLEKQRHKDAKEAQKQAKKDAKHSKSKTKAAKPPMELDASKLEEVIAPTPAAETQVKEPSQMEPEIIWIKDEMEPEELNVPVPQEPSETKARESIGFSFRKTVKNLLIFKSKKKLEEPKPTAKELHEQMVINIEMVSKSHNASTEDFRACPTFVVSVPTEPPASEDGLDQIGSDDTNMNLLEISETIKTTKEVNAKRTLHDDKKSKKAKKKDGQEETKDVDKSKKKQKDKEKQSETISKKDEKASKKASKKVAEEAPKEVPVEIPTKVSKEKGKRKSEEIEEVAETEGKLKKDKKEKAKKSKKSAEDVYATVEKTKSSEDMKPDKKRKKEAQSSLTKLAREELRFDPSQRIEITLTQKSYRKIQDPTTKGDEKKKKVRINESIQLEPKRKSKAIESKPPKEAEEVARTSSKPALKPSQAKEEKEDSKKAKSSNKSSKKDT